MPSEENWSRSSGVASHCQVCLYCIRHENHRGYAGGHLPRWQYHEGQDKTEHPLALSQPDDHGQPGKIQWMSCQLPWQSCKHKVDGQSHIKSRRPYGKKNKPVMATRLEKGFKLSSLLLRPEWDDLKLWLSHRSCFPQSSALATLFHASSWRSMRRPPCLPAGRSPPGHCQPGRGH